MQEWRWGVCYAIQTAAAAVAAQLSGDRCAGRYEIKRLGSVPIVCDVVCWMHIILFCCSNPNLSLILILLLLRPIIYERIMKTFYH